MKNQFDKRRLALLFAGVASISLCRAAAAQTAATKQAGEGPHTLTGGGLTMYFDTLTKAAVNDENRVDTILWYENGDFNYAANEPSSGTYACGDPGEFFGEAEGYPDVSQPPRMVAGGEHTHYNATVNRRFVAATAKIDTRMVTCPGVELDGLTRTIYRLNFDHLDALMVERTFRFKSGLGVLANTGLRAYVPRVVSNFPYVLLPNTGGKIVTYDSRNCIAAPCTVTDWNGAWFADDSGFDSGVIVIRASSSATPAFVGIQYGGASNANFTSIVLQQPAKGWSGIVTETEYLCFYNYLTWNQSATLPTQCLPKSGSATSADPAVDVK